MDLDSGIGGRVTAQWPVLVVSFNYRLSPFPSHRTHGSREGCFLQSWDGLQAYALPMFSLIWQVLQSWVLQADDTLLIPLDLLSLSVASPVVLPYRIDLPWQPHFHLLYQDFFVLCLLAWKPFSDLLDVLTCLRAWLVSSLCVVTVPPIAFASTGGIVLGVGALVRVIQC